MNEDELERLVEENCAEIFLLDGEERVRFHMDRLEVLHPELVEQVNQMSIDELDHDLLDLYNKGLLEMDYRILPDGTMETVWSITDLGSQVVEMLMERELG